MAGSETSWNYLVLTASNDAQARAYESQLQLREELGLLPGVREAFVLADWDGQRIGSGGSTLHCLAQVLNRERRRRGLGRSETHAETLLRGLRVLIVHAGGDSRRLPAYGPCGKIFIPLPSNERARLPVTLFDRIVPHFLELPPGPPGCGQILVTAGDALIRFDASDVRFTGQGITALGCYATPEEASRHGVFCVGSGGEVELYLQKPSLAEQSATRAINKHGKTALDIGITQLDAAAAAILLEAFECTPGAEGGFGFSAAARQRIASYGLDLYVEICCAMGSQGCLEHYLRTARAAGSRWPQALLAELYPRLSRLPLYVELVPECEFLHFGSTRQLIDSGLALMSREQGGPPASNLVLVNNALSSNGAITGADAWIEGCRISSSLELRGANIVVGVDIDEPLMLPPGACLDVLSGSDRSGRRSSFVRCYGIRDTFKHSVAGGALFCGRPLAGWLSEVGADPAGIWPGATEAAGRSLWDARVFPAEPPDGDFRRWLWMYAPHTASPAERRAYLAADRYSAAEIAALADQAAFHSRRRAIWADVVASP